MNKNNVILLGILLIAVLLRLTTLGQESFWLDEGATIEAVSSYSVAEIMANGLQGNVSPGYWDAWPNNLPLYFVILGLWVKIFPITEVGLRLFSALFGVLAVWLLYVLVREIKNAKTGLFAALLLAISLINIEYAQEARLYTFLSFITIASTYFLVRSQKHGKWYNYTAFVLLNVVGLYTHFPYVFIPAFQGLFVLFLIFRKEERGWNLFWSLGVAGITFIPMLLRMFGQTEGNGPWLAKPTIATIVKVWVMFNTWIYPSQELYANIYAKQFFAISFIDILLVLSIVFLVVVISLLFFFGIVGWNSVVNLLKKQSLKERFNGLLIVKEKWVLLIFLWFIVPFSLEYILSVLHPTANIFGPIRHLLFVFPAYLALAAIGLNTLPKKFSFVVVVMIVVASVVPFYAYYNNVNKQQIREVSLFVKENIQNDDLVIVNNPNAILVADYYGNFENVEKAFGRDDANEHIDGHDSVWLIHTGEKYTDPDGEIRGLLEESYSLEEELVLFDAKAFHYTR